MTEPNLSRRLFLTGLMLSVGPGAFAQPRISEAELAILSASPASHAVSDRLVRTKEGRVYRIFTALPRQTPPARGYPVLYMLDGNAAFNALTVELLASAPELVIIGVGYDTPLRVDVEQRSLDYTPPVAAEPVADPKRPGRRIGGADRFLESLVGELRDEAERGIDVDADRRALWGHSYGGLFTLYTLFVRPDFFGRYCAISPSVGWHESRLLAFEEAAAQPGSPKDVLIALGDSERRFGDNTQPAGPAPRTMELIGRLRAKSGIRLQAHVLQGRSHGATMADSLPMSLGFSAGQKTDLR